MKWKPSRDDFLWEVADHGRTTIKERSFSLEREALKASGIKEKRTVELYSNRIDSLYYPFIPSLLHSSDPVTKARILFDFLWATKPFRYEPGGPFRLSEVINSQLDKESRTVGNCLGLTLLYNCLLQRAGLHVGTLFLENAFGIGPHVLTLLSTNESLIDIENILPDGFDYK